MLLQLKVARLLVLTMNSSFDEFGEKFPLLFQRYIPEWGKLVLTLLLPLSHLACQRPVTRLWRHPKITPILATTLTLFENRIKWVFGAFMLLMTFDETMSNDFLLEYVKGNPSYLRRESDDRLKMSWNQNFSAPWREKWFVNQILTFPSFEEKMF